MPAHKAYDKPSTVTAVDGEVAMCGPGGLGLSLTPEAAARTGQRLDEAAAEARDQPAREVGEEDDEP